MAPGHTRQTPDHPPYAEMISAAITALNEKGGSTAVSIDSFIKSKYSKDVLPQAHSNLFTYHLSKLLHLGEIRESTPNFYIVPPEDHNAPNPNPNPNPNPSPTTTPPSPSPSPSPSSSPSDAPTSAVEPAFKKRKRRGRPPRPRPETEQHRQAAAAAAAKGGEDVPRRRGRPSRRKEA